MSIATTETKVWAAVVGAGGGTVVGNAALWALGVYVWNTPDDAAHAKAALEAVPTYIAALVLLSITVLGTWFGGYSAPPSNHAGNNATGEVMDDTDAGHPAPALPDGVTIMEPDSHVAGH
jgi:hypothetical protein